MTDEPRENELTEEELEETNGEPLPDREEMAILDPDPLVSIPTPPAPGD
jgi:hypothetical protein